MIIAEIPKANYCSFFCFLLTMDECIINVWGYTEILPFLAPKVPVLRRNKVTHSSTSTDPFSAATKTLVLGNLFKNVWFAITFARAVCHWREWQEWDNCQIFFIVFIPKWQTFLANVMSSLKTLNKLPTSTRAFSAAEKWTVRGTGVIGFISPQNGNLRR